MKYVPWLYKYCSRYEAEGTLYFAHRPCVSCDQLGASCVHCDKCYVCCVKGADDTPLAQE